MAILFAREVRQEAYWHLTEYFAGNPINNFFFQRYTDNFKADLHVLYIFMVDILLQYIYNFNW